LNFDLDASAFSKSNCLNYLQTAVPNKYFVSSKGSDHNLKGLRTYRI